MMYSVTALIFGRHHHGDHLALDTGERAAAAHQFDIEIVMVAHGLRVDAVNLDDIILIVHAPFRWDPFFRYIVDERHSIPGLSLPGQAF
jgi:hypothetical protein